MTNPQVIGCGPTAEWILGRISTLNPIRVKGGHR